MRRLAKLLLVSSALLGSIATTGCEDHPPPPGYTGPIAGTLARDTLHALENQRFQDHDGVFGGGEWTVGKLTVAPYPGDPTRKGPYVLVQQMERSIVLPMEADGDAADLYRRVRGSPHPQLPTPTSEPYRAALARASRP